MGIVFRQSVKTSIVFLAGAVLGAISTYLMARIFTPVEAGITRNLITQAVVIQSFLIVGMPAVLVIYIPKLANQHEKIKVLITYAFLLPLVVALFFFIPYFHFEAYIVSRYQVKDQAYIRQYFNWMPFFAIIWCYVSVLEMYLLSQMKAAASSFMREILLRLLLILLIVAYYLKWINLHSFVTLTILCHIIPLAGLLLLSVKTKDFGFSFAVTKAFSTQEIRKISSFAWYHLLAGITVYLMGYLDALILGSQSHKGLGDVQVYGIVVFFATFLTLPYKSMANASTPKINEAYHHNDMPLVKSLFIRTSDNMLIGVIAMWLLIIPNMHNAEALLRADYKGITILVSILSIGKLTDILTGPNSELIGLSKHYKFLFRATVVLVLGIVVFDRIFIPKYGIYAAAWVTTACTIVYNLFKMAFLYFRMHIHPFGMATFKILFAAAIACIPAFLLPDLNNPFLDTFYRATIVIPIYISALYILKSSADLNTYLISIRRNKRLF